MLTISVIIGLNKFINSLTQEDQDTFTSLITKAKETLKVHFIFIDVPSGFKPYEYESWYKNAINDTSGLWINDGFAEQYIIKPTKTLQEYYKKTSNK